MKQKPLPDHPLSFLHLGDSYTIGEGVPKEKSWPYQMKRILEIKGKRYHDIKILAQTGWTTRDLMDAMETNIIESAWDLVTLCIGANNQYQGLSVENYADDLKVLLETTAGLVSGKRERVILLSIPDWSVTPFAEDRDPTTVAREIARFNESARLTAENLDFPFVDWTPLIQLHGDEIDAFTEDGLHPSAGQYERWASFLVQHLVPGI